MSDYVFPQFNDYDDPQNFAFHLGQSNLGDFVEYGLSLTADHVAETFDLSEGKAYVEQTEAVGDASGETRHRLVYGVHVDAIADVAFATTTGVNYVWLDANVGAQDSPDIVVETNDAAPSDASLKLGEIDAGADSAAVEMNREPTPTFGPTTFAGDVDVGANVLQSIASAEFDGDVVVQPETAGSDYYLRDGDGANLLVLDGETADFSNVGQNVRVREGRGIEDPDGDIRLYLSTSHTDLRGPNGGNSVIAWDDRTELRSRSSAPLRIYDEEGSFIGVEYQTSSSTPGVLELTNSKLDAGGNNVENVAALTKANSGGSGHVSRELVGRYRAGGSEVFDQTFNVDGGRHIFKIDWRCRTYVDDSPSTLALQINGDNAGQYRYTEHPSGTTTADQDLFYFASIDGNNDDSHGGTITIADGSGGTGIRSVVASRTGTEYSGDYQGSSTISSIRLFTENGDRIWDPEVAITKIDWV